ncbi:hypothetical protein D9V37_16120 [Nocardioides mangrovicus]|uniref:Uncharacterized protein n=1 Tax=Nocardioides mangrovicus TaxID=2478913 RepID=A0A3L8NXY3_9ACTN|nr:hypothetical protein D9V37_16120 [Nocardioides mangrovicus]
MREELHPKLGTKARVQAFMDRGYRTDLSAASSIDESAAALDQHYGFSPANAEWEAYAQSRSGAVMVLQLPSDTDMDAVQDHLETLGYTRPGSDLGVWKGGVDLVASIDPTISPELQYVVVDAAKHLVLTSDNAGYAGRSARVLSGDADSLSGSSLPSLAGRSPEPAAAYLWRGGFACEDLSMSQADASDQRTADRLVRRAGGVDSLDGVVMGMRADRGLDVTLGFENDQQAKDNLRSRARLFVGPAVGRAGSYADDFRLTRSRTDGDAVLLTAKPRAKDGFVLSQVDDGPVLFATC